MHCNKCRTILSWATSKAVASGRYHAYQPDVWGATVKKPYRVPVAYGGGKAAGLFDGEYFPQETKDALKEISVAIKGPLTTPIGEGYRSLSVVLRQQLDLYAYVRPVHYYQHVPSLLRYSEQVDVVVFREKTEDVYAGIDHESGSPKNDRLVHLVRDELGARFFEDASLGIKPISTVVSP